MLNEGYATLVSRRGRSKKSEDMPRFRVCDLVKIARIENDWEGL